MNLVEEALTGHWGPKCSEYEEGCIVCDAWREYENLVTYGASEPKEEKVISNAPPLTPEIMRAFGKLIMERTMNDLDNKTK
jgi:hypothetical protein